MNNVRISIDLTKVEGARTIKAKAPNGNNEYYVAVPASSLFIPKNANKAFLTCTMIPSPNALYGDFMLKPYINGNTYANMSDEERKAVPIIGKGTFIKERLSKTAAQVYEKAEVETVTALPPTPGNDPAGDQGDGLTNEPASSPNAPSPDVVGLPEAEKLFVRTHDGRDYAFISWAEAERFAEDTCKCECVIELWRGSIFERRYIFNAVTMQWEY